MSFFTNLDSPPKSTKPHVWADYIEVVCLESRDKSVGFRAVERVLLSLDLEQEDAELLKDVGVDDLNDNDGRVALDDAGEGWVEEGFRHAKNRAEVYGDGYPFLVDEASFEITLKEEVTDVARLYIALLLCANHKYAYGKRKDLTSGFEEICYQALQTLLPSGGEVRLIGTTHAGNVLGITPTSNRKIHKFDAMAKLLNTKPGYDPQDYSPHDTGESGADLLGWVPFGDGALPEEIVVVGQCATTKDDWDKKQIDCDPLKWLSILGLKIPSINMLFLAAAPRRANGKFETGNDRSCSAVWLDRQRIFIRLSVELSEGRFSVIEILPPGILDLIDEICPRPVQPAEAAR